MEDTTTTTPAAPDAPVVESLAAVAETPAERWQGSDDLRPLLVRTADVQAYDMNPRKHGSRSIRAIRAIRASLEAFGQRKPFVVFRFEGQMFDTVIAGNGGLQAARELGWTHIAVTRFEGSASDAEAFAITDNATAEHSAWERERLKVAAASMRARDDLRKLYDAIGIHRHVPEVTSGGDREEAAALPPVPVTHAGDLWVLGRHRLMCGDTFDAGARGALLNGHLAACVVTDPPFAIYGSSTGIGRDIADDKMVRPFFTEMFRAIHEHARTFGHIYVHCDWRSWSAIVESAKRCDIVVKNCLVWDKGHFGMGGMYGNAHEFLGFFAKLPPARTMVADERKGIRNVFGKPNILRFPRVSSGEREHNAAKPVEMLLEILENSSDPGDSVLDLFGGSGSTLIAAERGGRSAYVMETEPKWCDVIVRRYLKLGGTTATREADGVAFSELEA